MPVLHETGYNKSRSDYHISDRLLLSVYIRCEMTPIFRWQGGILEFIPAQKHRYITDSIYPSGQSAHRGYHVQ